MKVQDALILFYHRIAEGVDDPFKLCVSPAKFAAHLDEIGRYGELSTLDDLNLPSLRPRIVVTFDDGYSDNLINAVPIAEAKGVPVTIFVTSGLLGSHNGFWWDRLGALLSSRPSEIKEITLPSPEGSVRVGLGSTRRRKDLQSVRRYLLPLPTTEIHGILDEVSLQWGVSAAPPPDARPLTPSEFRKLAASDVVTIGDHTVDHVQLRGLDAEDQQQMIASSKERLERLSGQVISHFAYPYEARTPSTTIRSRQCDRPASKRHARPSRGTPAPPRTRSACHVARSTTGVDFASGRPWGAGDLSPATNPRLLYKEQ
jgi:peptidoglycan/xylan/chitin deacetylase (PgdA/CDA1 family)